jgi:TolB protein
MKKSLLLCVALLKITLSHADQNIEIIGGNNISTPPIAIMDFTNNDDSGNNNIANIIANDINVSGDIKAINISSNQKQIESNITYIVSGVVKGDNISYTLQQNNESSTVVLTNTIINLNKNTRLAAHTISNQIYQKLTNTPGIFTTKIAYIAQDKRNYKLIVADYDGFNPKVILSTKNIIASLAWSPNGSQIAYISLESGKPVVYVQNVYTPSRFIVANFPGSNSSPTFTPTGSQIAVTLTKDSGSHIYLVDNTVFSSNSSAIPLISDGSIDTEADIGANENIVFTSNHDGGPQIFMANLSNTSAPKRLTINLGNYNTTARLAHNLSKITFIHRDMGTLRTYVQDLRTGANYPVSMGTSLDTAPSFAPNDKLILFSSGNAVYIVNTNGTTQTKLNTINYNQIIDLRWANNY